MFARNFSMRMSPVVSRVGSARVAGVVAAGAAAVGGSVAYANEEDHGIPPANYPWTHDGMIGSFDHQSIRRGYQVYKNVCATCHSLKRIAWRNMDGVCYATSELKEMAGEVDYPDGVDEMGEPVTRPGKTFDYMPNPYESEDAARGANAGALPPDLSLITKARHNGNNYVFSILTGFVEPPVNCELASGQHYNPYFPGGKIAMAKPLVDGQVDYDDGTPATVSQMAKDVTTFLAWCSEPEHDDRKKAGMKWCTALFGLCITSAYVKRFRWSLFKGRKIQFASTVH